MATFKVVVADPKTRKSQSVEVKDPQALAFVGLKIGEEVDALSLVCRARSRLPEEATRQGFP